MEGTPHASLSGPVDPSVRAFSERLKFTVRRHNFTKKSSRQAVEGGGGTWDAKQGRALDFEHFGVRLRRQTPFG